MEGIEDVMAALKELLEDTTLPKSAKQILKDTAEALSKAKDRVEVSRALSALEELADNSNLQSEHRTQLFNIVSMLETV